MIRIAVVEDHPKNREELTGFLRRYQTERNLELRVTCFQDGAEIVEQYRLDYDVILMDIQMERMDGMTAAERIRQLDPEVILIFITNMSQYAIQGYAVDALDYVLKPVNYFAFSQRLDRAVARLNRANRKKASYLVVQTKGGTQKVEIGAIRYVESVGHSLILHMGREDLVSSGTLTNMESQLSEYGFSRCNKGYLVNLEFVDAVREGCAVIGGDKLVISRGRKATFMKQLADYMGGQTR